MRFPSILVLLSACEPSPSTCAPSDTEVAVSVIDVTGSIVEGALVELSGEACGELGGGDYLCLTDQGGRHDLFVYDPRWQAHAEFLELPEPGCTAHLASVDVLLEQGMGL